MSSFATIAYAGAAFLFSDRAVWNQDETLHSLRTKIDVAECGQFAVTTKGDMRNGAQVARMLCDRADKDGVGVMLDEMQEFATWLGEQLGIDNSVMGLKVCVAAWAPGQGGVYTAFQSSQRGQNASTLNGTKEIVIKPWTVAAPVGGIHWSGGKFNVADIMKFGLGRRPGEPEAEWSRRLGWGILQTMRMRRGGGEDGAASIVGGGIDMAELGPDGGALIRLVDWPQDIVGEKIDPFRGMSPDDRRRIEKMVA